MKEHVKSLIYRLLIGFLIAAILYAVGVRFNLVTLIAVPLIWAVTLVLFILNARNALRCLELVKKHVKHKVFNRILVAQFSHGTKALSLDIIATALILNVMYLACIDYCVFPLCAIIMSLILNIVNYKRLRNNKRLLYNLLRIKDEDNAQ